VLRLDTANDILNCWVALHSVRLLLCISTHSVDLEPSAAVTNTLEDFLDLYDETGMEHRTRELDVSKVSRAFGHAFQTRLALEVAIDG
jgi:hypothetical protein